jgi:hypothetical protein
VLVDLGIYRTDDGGATWTRTSPLPATQDYGLWQYNCAPQVPGDQPPVDDRGRGGLGIAGGRGPALSEHRRRHDLHGAAGRARAHQHRLRRAGARGRLPGALHERLLPRPGGYVDDRRRERSHADVDLDRRGAERPVLRRRLHHGRSRRARAGVGQPVARACSSVSSGACCPDARTTGRRRSSSAELLPSGRGMPSQSSQNANTPGRGERRGPLDWHGIHRA